MSFKYLALQMANCCVDPFLMLECVGVLLETLQQIKMTGGTPEVRSVKINLIDF